MTDELILKKLSLRHNLKKKILNSFLRNKLFSMFGKEQSKYWASRKFDSDKRGINSYINLSSTSYPLIDEIIYRSNGNKNIRILDLCCNIGRHLNELLKNGFTNIHGIDINSMCQEYMLEYFPELYKTGSFVWGSVEANLPKYTENYFDIIFTHGKTIEHINPSFNLVKYLCMISSKFIILGNVGLNSGTFPRFWIYEFDKYGFILVKLLQPESEWSKNSSKNRPHSLIVLKKFK